MIESAVDKTPADNAVLADLAAAGDRAAFQRLMERHAGVVHAIGAARLGDPAEAEDLAQEVFFRAWLLLPKLRDKRAVTAWLSTLARNLAGDWNRAAARQSARLAGYARIAPNDCDSRVAVEDAEALAAVRRAMERLPEEVREAVFLHFEEDRTPADIARQLGVHPATIGRRIERGLGMLRGEIVPRAREASRRGGRRSLSKGAAAVAALLAMAADDRAALASQAASITPLRAISANSTTGALWLWWNSLSAGWKCAAVAIATAAVLAGASLGVGVSAPPSVPRLLLEPGVPGRQLARGAIRPGQGLVVEYAPNPLGVARVDFGVGADGRLRSQARMSDGRLLSYAMPPGVDFSSVYYAAARGPLVLETIQATSAAGGGIDFAIEVRQDEALGRVKDDPTLDPARKLKVLAAAIRAADYFPADPELRKRAKASPDLSFLNR